MQALLLSFGFELRCAMWGACQSSSVLRDGICGGSKLLVLLDLVVMLCDV